MNNHHPNASVSMTAEPPRFKQTSLLVGGLILCMALPATAFAGSPSPWKEDVAYGKHPRQNLDAFKPDGPGPFPFVLDIHGGGWHSGDKKFARGSAKRYLDAGVAVIYINYRFVGDATKDGLYPPIKGPFFDTQRALQFTRLHAKEWGLDPTRVALTGSSAGCLNALWLGLSSDMANPKSDDPVERMSTRVTAIGVGGATTTIDPKEMRDWVGPEYPGAGQLVGLAEFDFAGYLKKRVELEKYFDTLSPPRLLSKDAPPIFLQFSHDLNGTKKDKAFYVHSPGFGVGFQKLAKEKGVECHVAWKNHPAEGFKGDMADFNIQHLVQKK